MKSNRIRETFLDFFKKKGHQILPGSPLIPSDPSVLLTLAGMLQFKPYFLGVEKSPYQRAATVQKCVRMNDIENVGKTSRHQTFFEMLGNFSFGDYFKTEAIGWAWELLTEVFGLSTEKLLVAVYKKDEETFGIWKDRIKVPADKIFKLEEANNFWAAGPTGPCGPCSEIYYDLGKKIGCGRTGCQPGCDCDRFLEVWNLVFIEFNRNEKGDLESLPSKNIDTGMGLERIAAILQGVESNFETDLLKPIVDEISRLSQNKQLESFRIIADHLRAAVYLLGDGIVPSNEGRGYVLRRIIRRALLHGLKLKLAAPLLVKLAGLVIEIGKDFYPELLAQHKVISLYLMAEEEQFGKTLAEGLLILEKMKQENKIDAFKLYDTYGFPVELTQEIAGVKVDFKKFEAEMEKQRERARAKKVFKIQTSQLDRIKYVTKFVGYQTLECEAQILDIIDSKYIVFDKSPFYAESGGQVSDKGYLKTKNSEAARQEEFRIKNLSKNPAGTIFHELAGNISKLKPGDKVSLIVDKEARMSTARHHTATHLLHQALKKVLGEHAQQSGSLVSPQRLRFDFHHFSALKPAEIEKIEEIVNAQIKQNLKVECLETSLAEAKNLGATALFGEKYGEQVRVIKITGYNQELCGGTHVDHTGEIKLFKIMRQSAVAAGIRRVEAVAGMPAEEYCLEKARELELEKQQAEFRRISKEKEKLDLEAKTRAYSGEIEKILENLGVKNLAGFNFIFADTLFEVEILADAVSNKLKSKFIIILFNSTLKKLVVKTSGEIAAQALIKFITAQAGGGGGGSKNFAKAGGFDPARLDLLQPEIEKYIHENIGS